MPWHRDHARLAGGILFAMPENIHAVERPVTTDLDLREFDLRRPGVGQRLTERTPTGGYVVPDTMLVRALRAHYLDGEIARSHELFEILLDRCKPTFRSKTSGLAGKPTLREDAISEMKVQLWKEAIDPRETFMVQNFGHYIKCLCADHFNRVLRAEGYGYRTNEQGQVTGRPEHVPAVLIDSLSRPASGEDDQGMGDTLADVADPLNARVSSLLAQDILDYLPDMLDRKIVTLRAMYDLKWDEIAKLCGKSERTMRTRYERAIVTLHEAVTADERR